MWGIASIGYALIIGGIYVIIMYIIIMTLLVGIKKLYGNDEKDAKYKFTTVIVTLVISVSMLMIIAGLAFLKIMK